VALSWSIDRPVEHAWLDGTPPLVEGTMKSDARDLLELLTYILKDVVSWCPANVSVLRDLQTLQARVETEGVSFLTITLPQFCRDFEQALQQGVIGSTHFRNFRKRGLIPAFLQGITSHVFDQESGRLRNEVNPIFIEAVRHVCLAFKKLELPCTPARESAALDNFVRVEQSLSEFSASADDTAEFARVAAVLWDNALVDVRVDQLIPRHGPGATAEGISGNQKYRWSEWYDRLERSFPIIENGYSIAAVDDECFSDVTIVPENKERPVRVVLVPKTLKAPRVIAIEPVCMQYAQQAVRAELYARIERYWLTAGHVNFTDQSINRACALTSSKTGQLATIDLSDASDRVPLSLVPYMFRSNPDLWELIDACRSRSADLPDGRHVAKLHKFASMGSALCFPIESMYFYTIVVAALLAADNLPPTQAHVYEVSRSVFVYGDDIIVPAVHAGIVLDYLQKYNCKVNESKTFLVGKFRESCGLDAYDGHEVTPIYVRRMRPKHKQQAHELVSWIATANLFNQKGLEQTADFMFRTCEVILGPLPYVSRESSVLGRVSNLGTVTVEKRCGKLHTGLVRGYLPSPVYRSDSVDGYSALQKSLMRLTSRELTAPTPYFSREREGWMIRLDEEIASDPLHMERTALRGAVTLKRRWVPA